MVYWPNQSLLQYGKKRSAEFFHLAHFWNDFSYLQLQEKELIFSFRAVSYCIYLHCPPSPKMRLFFHSTHLENTSAKMTRKTAKCLFHFTPFPTMPISYPAFFYCAYFRSAISNNTYCLTSYEAVYSVYVCLDLKKMPFESDAKLRLAYSPMC